jgi:peptidoglycan-associated lipoprotein
MRMNMRTLSAVVFTVVLAMSVAACKKKAAAPPPPPPPPAAPKEPPPPPPPAARITNFSVEPSSIQRGQSATLTWAVANATDIAIDNGVGAVQANGTRQVFPTNTTTYTLTARSTGGTDTRSVTVTVTAPPPPPPPPPAAPKRTGAQIFTEELANMGLADALFDYDKSDIRDDARSVLTRAADALKRAFAVGDGFNVVLEGHCDERGSAEYNLGLGDRRATSAKDFLVQLGVPADKIRNISYGKDRPVCTDANEACYQRNRRAHLAPAQ